MSEFYLSVIIPTYKRNKKLKRLLDEIINQVPQLINIEIVVVGNKNLNFNYHKRVKKNISVKLFLINRNSNAAKRNKGIEASSGKYIILIDDDCLPGKNFIVDYLYCFKKIKDRQILCGSVKYLQTTNESKNFIRYRQSRHFVVSNRIIDKKNYLKATHIVTMNMGFKNSKLLNKFKYFDEKFGGYGFEDYEFGYRYIKNGFKFIKSKPLVYHLDNRNYESFLNKIYYLGRYCVLPLSKINYDSWINTIYYKIENNTLVNLLLRINFIYPLTKMLEKVIIFIEKNFLLYLPKLYRFGIFLSYCRGYYDRKELKKFKKNNWYE